MSRHWKLIAGGVLLELALLGGSTALGIYLGRRFAAEELRHSREEVRPPGVQNQTTQKSLPAQVPNPPRTETLRADARGGGQSKGAQPSGPGGTGARGAAEGGAKGVAEEKAKGVAEEEAGGAGGDDTKAAARGGLGSVPPSYIVVAGGLALAVLALALYFLVISPRRKRRPMLEAFEIINRDEHAEFPRAESLLGEALTKGLRAKDIADARFALAYVRARLGRFSEAAAVLADLTASGKSGREEVYLDLWLQARLKEDEKIIRLYQEHAAALGDLLDAKLIAGIALLNRARHNWARREVDDALHYFAELRKLGVLTEEIPGRVDDHETVIGIMSLFDRETDEARKHFAGAVAAAREQGKPALHGELGLLLCDWVASDNPDVDEALGEVLKGLERADATAQEMVNTACKFCGKKYEAGAGCVGKAVGCTGCRRRFIVEVEKDAKDSRAPSGDDGGGAAEPAAQPERLLDEEEILLRNALLWHAVSLLFTWRGLPPGGGLPPGSHDELSDRLNRVRDVDAEMPDPYLIEGLINYYFFSASDSEREAAVAAIDKAASKGVNVPEVLNLADREHRLAEFRRDSLNRFLALVKNYLTDQGVPEHLREQLKARLERFSRFAQMGEIDLTKGEEDAAPSLVEMQARGVLLCKRVDSIVKPRLADADSQDREAIEGLIRNLDRTTKTLTKKIERLEQTEYSLMEATGEFLFHEEEAATEAEEVAAEPATK
ncbi:MAG: hypothetical protein M3416_13410 [Acidobacteriota bacterium]|nr:hypothetical protein [Acidobacteriota bacterium]